MRKNLLFAVFSAIVVLALAVSPVGAITGNYVKDFDHPFVGMVVFFDADGVFIGRCSGSLLSSTTLLTAGHCVEGAATARVYFQQDAGVNYDPITQVDPVTGYPEYCADDTLGILCAESSTLYNYGNTGFPNTHDAGLVILDQAISMPEYGVLAGAGTLDNLTTARGKKDTVFTVSGYGLTYRTNDKDALPNISYRERLMAQSTLVNLGSNLTDGYNLQTQGNGNDRGGTCNGDSGGPVFLGGPDSNLIVAITSFGLNTWCRGTDFSYRVDRAEVLDWIAEYAE
jgi:secreted trypsin-like serine protease